MLLFDGLKTLILAINSDFFYFKFLIFANLMLLTAKQTNALGNSIHTVKLADTKMVSRLFIVIVVYFAQIFMRVFEKNELYF